MFAEIPAFYTFSQIHVLTTSKRIGYLFSQYHNQHNDTQHNDTQHNDTQHKEPQHNETQHNDIQHNNFQHKGSSCTTQHQRHSA